MNVRHILLCLALSLLGAGLRAQNELPQVFSPNAAELGKYGKIPVSYFNGLPNISIPLTELRAKGYTLPIYLTYHAGGNKPDQHPGWVGLGWTLHAGGCINRIVHGARDEMANDECLDIYGVSFSEAPGYLYKASSFQDTQIDSVYMKDRFQNGLLDLDPDEFQINFDGLNSSFYFSGEQSIKIASSAAISYTVELIIEPEKNIAIYDEPNLRASQYETIAAIRVITTDGTVYCFGGTDDSVEYSFEIVKPVAGFSALLKRVPNTWNITSITLPDGEEIRFDYVKDGMPIITHDRHYMEYCAWDPNNPSQGNSWYLYNTMEEQYGNLRYSLLSPSYLQKISSTFTGEEISFSISPTTELSDTVNVQVFREKFTNPLSLYYSECEAENKYQQLDRIDSPRGSILFEYTSSPLERLKLKGVSIGDDSIGKYSMDYDSLLLPGYHSRQTDMWGYYSRRQELDETGRYYQVDSAACQAEILKILRYPTGGETHFEYEIHHYGQVAGQYPFSLFEEIGVAGGLRIRKITDYSGDTVNERRFRYVDIGGASSGISAVKPRYDAEGSVTVGLEPQYIQESLSLFYYPDFSITLPYTFSGERRLNQIPLTGGCHVTYSRVEEWFPDSSKVVYCYTNHENNPDVPFIQAISSFNDWGLYNSFSSHSLSRGLLLKKEVYSKGCATPLSVEEYEYLRDSTDYVQGLNEITHCGGLLRRCAHILYYTYFPVLANKKVIVYPDNGGFPFIETTRYTYDSHRRLTGTTRRVGGVTERDTLTYTGNITTGDYAGMAAHNMIAYPVEKVRFRKDTLQSEKVISADLTTWKRWGDRFVPSETYKANVGSGSTGAFRFYNGSRKDFKYLLEPEQRYVAYDSLANILLAEDHAGVPTSYVWTPDGCHPAAVFTGAKVGYTKYVTSDVARVLNYQLEPTEDVSLQFESVSSFTLRIWLTCPNNQCWDLAPVVDGTDYRIVCVNDPQAPSPWPANAVSYPSPLEIPLPAGIHSVSIRPSSHMYVVNSTDPVTFSIEVDYKEKQVTEQQIAGHTVVFEDFEDEEGELVPEGYNSEKGHRGTWTHTLDASKGPYYVDYRVYRNGKWNYVRQRETGSSTSISEGFAPIDHVRIYPVDCLPESYTWNEDGTLRSKTDSRGVTESYSYDGLGRLVGVYDNDGKKVEGYEYNYQNR